MAFPADPLDVTVEMAIGEDPSADPSTWSWTDITDYVLHRDGIRIVRGKNDRFGSAAPSSLELTVDNTDGRFVVRNPLGAYYPNLRRNVPIRVSVDDVPRFTGFVDQLPVSWDVSGADPHVRLRAFGPLKRLSRPTTATVSTPRQFILSTDPIAYWPLEDGELASDGAAAAGPAPMTSWNGTHPSGGAVVTRVRWGTGSLGPWLPPVASLPSATGLQVLVGYVPMAPTATTWTVDFMYAGSGGSGGVTLDINPSYLGGDAGWPQLILDPAGGELQVTMNGEAATDGSVPTLFDGLGHHVRWTAIQDGANVSWTAYVDGVQAQSDTTSGSMTLPPIQSLAFVADDATGDVLGHVAVWVNPPSVLAAAGAALGWPGETAGRRIARLCDEQNVALTIPDEYRIVDTFDRTSSNSWGDADTGQTWTLSGGSSADFDVSGGQATIAQGSATVVRAAVIGEDVAAFDARVLIEVPAVSTGGAVGIHAGIVFRWVSDSDHYRAQIRFQPGGSMDFGLARAGGAGIALGTNVAVSGSYTTGTRMWVRARGSGALFYGKVWRDGDPEPLDWNLERDDDELAAGKVGVFCRRGVSDTTSSNTYIFESFSADSILDDTQPMGPQPYDALMKNLEQGEEVDGGILSETTAGEMEYLPVRSRYNRDVDLSLDYDEGHVAPPFEPSDDDVDLRNDVTAARSGGGSYQYTDPDHIAAEGRYDEAPILNAASDSQLPDLASWRVHLGTVPELRYPRLTLYLHRNPGLIDEWLTCRLGSRITVDNPPPELPPDVIDQHLLGYAETITSYSWTVEANLAPASPYTVGIWEDDVYGRADTDGSQLGSAINSSTTSISVETTAGEPWITTASFGSQFPFDIRVGGEVMTVTAITGASSPQTFTVTRSVNGVIKAHADETPVSLAHPMIIGL